MGKSDNKGLSFRDLLKIIFSRHSIILITFLAVTLLVLGISLITRPKYEASTKILTKERKVEPLFQAKYFNDYRTERVAFLQSQTEIIRSDEVTRRVLAKLYPTVKSFSQKQIKSLQQNVKVSSPKGFDIQTSDILTIRVTDTNPVRAAETSNRLTEEFINYTYELKGRAANQTVDFLEKQSQVQLENIKQAEKELKSFEGKSSPELAFLISMVKNKGANNELITFNNNYINATMALKETEIYLIQVREIVRKGTVPQTLLRENPVLAAIKDNIVKLESQLATLRSQFTDFHPKNIMIINEIDRNKQLLNKEIKADIDGRFSDLVGLETRVKVLKKTLDHYTVLAQKQMEYSRLYLNYEVLEEGYQDLLRDIQKARFLAAMDNYKLADIEIIDKAQVPKSPVSPNIILNTIIGMLIGALLGLVLAFIFGHFDHTLKTVEDVEHYLNLPVLGSVPRR